MKILKVTLKKEWYDMESHVDPEKRKDEEYRAIKLYWIQRLIDINLPEETKGANKNVPESIVFDLFSHNWEQVLKSYHSTFKNFDVYEARNGYGKNAPLLQRECLGITIGKAKPEWSNNWQGNVFIIRLGEIINIKK